MFVFSVGKTTPARHLGVETGDWMKGSRVVLQSAASNRVNGPSNQSEPYCVPIDLRHCWGDRGDHTRMSNVMAIAYSVEGGSKSRAEYIAYPLRSCSH